MKLTLWKKKASETSPGAPGAHSGTHSGGGNGQQIRVLMIDDEESFTRLTKRNLEAEGGFAVQTENKARNAVHCARAFRPDVILLDVMMPDGDGGEVAMKLGQVPEVKDIPIIFLTAAIKGSELGNQPGGMIGGRFYIAKPVSTDDLMAYIRETAKH